MSGFAPCLIRRRAKPTRGISQVREMVPGFDLFLAHALSRQHGRARRVRRAGWLLQIVVERLQRVAHRRVAEKPREELGVALSDLDRETRSDAARSSVAAACSGTACRLNIPRGRAESDHMHVGK